MKTRQIVSIIPWIGQNEQTRLLVHSLDLIGECTGRVTPCERLAARVLAELQYRTLPILTSREHTNILRILDGSNDACCQHKLLPCLRQVDHVHTAWLTPRNVALHLKITVLGAKMALCCKHHEHILLLVRGEHGSHFDCAGRCEEANRATRAPNAAKGSIIVYRPLLPSRNLAEVMFGVE